VGFNRQVRRLLAFGFGFGLTGLVVFAGSLAYDGFWLTPAMAGFLGALLLGRPWIPLGYTVSLGLVAVALWLISSPSHVTRLGDWDSRVGPLFLGAGLLGLIWLGRSVREAPKGAVRWLVLLAIMVWGVAFFSGGAGSAGRMLRFLQNGLGLGPDVAHAVTLLFRKGVHFTFYGFLALVALAAARRAGESMAAAARLGLGVALVVSTYDELRQAQTADRSANPLDVLLDMAGAAVFVGIAASAASRRPVKS